MMWDHPDPIFLDFETQSACDIAEAGGRLYAAHPSTRVLLLVWTDSCPDSPYNVYVPDHIRVNLEDCPQRWLWPNQCGKPRHVEIHRGTRFPTPLLDKIKAGHPVVAHNAYMFDRYIWDRFCDVPACWLDSMLLARAYGRPGGLDALSKQLLGIGKDQAKTLMKKLTVATGVTVSEATRLYEDETDYTAYPLINYGEFTAFLRYAVVDVELLRRIWCDDFSNLEVEADVISANDAVNRHGVRVDKTLLAGLTELSRYSQEQAFNQIFELTRDTPHPLDMKAVRSHQQMHRWLRSYGVEIVDSNGKPCLRKEVVQQTIDSPFVISDHLTAAVEIPPLVVQVLELRLKALRITDAKLNRARGRIDKRTGRIHDLHSYHVAHTGRFSSSGVQIHNLPRPIEEIPTAELLSQIDWACPDRTELFDKIKSNIPDRTANGRSITVDDVCSTLLRPAFIPGEDRVFAIADFAQIEARLAAWAADEKKLTQAFLDGRDPYKEFAAKLFNVEQSGVSKLQRQIAKSAILGAQYGIGPAKLRVYAAAMGADLTKAGLSAETLVDEYRDYYTKICGFKPQPASNFRVDGVWHKLDKAVKTCVDTGVPQFAGKCEWFIERKNLCCRLPSGRIIYYPEPRIEDVVPAYAFALGLPANPKSTVVFSGAHGPKSLYGGLLFENIVQAMARDVLCDKLCLTISRYPVVLHIHDEIVAEVPRAEMSEALRWIVEGMSTPPHWCPDLPLEVEGYCAPRFFKKPLPDWPTLDTKSLRHGVA